MTVLLTSDGVRVRVRHLPPTEPRQASRELAIVVGHGFTGSMDRPAVQAVMAALRPTAGTIGLDFRGHGGSTGVTTLGDREIYDLEAAVSWARTLGYERVATLGFSMGGATAVRHAALIGGVDAIVTVSAPAWWFYRDTVPMRRVHWLIETRRGRLLSQVWRRTRIDRNGWQTVPRSPIEVVGEISPTPLLIVHGTADPFFPAEHGQRLFDAAQEPRELWLRPGLGHAETAADADVGLLAQIGQWVRTAVGAPVRAGS